jgi:hypothetical protein
MATELKAEELIAPTDEERTVRAGWRTIGQGLLLIVLAVMALYAASDLPGRRGFALGPGTMPSLLSAALLVLGIAAVVEEFFRGRILMPASMSRCHISAAGAIFIVAELRGSRCCHPPHDRNSRRHYLRTIHSLAVVVTSIVFVLLVAVRRLSS